MEKRIRGRLLQEIRRRHLSAQPLCVHCAQQGRVRLATQIDHIRALVRGGPESRDPFLNRQALCDECHASKTNDDLGRSSRRAIGADGWPIEEPRVKEPREFAQRGEKTRGGEPAFFPPLLEPARNSSIG